MTNQLNLADAGSGLADHGLVMLSVRRHEGDQVTVINWPAEARTCGLAVAPEWRCDYGFDGQEWTGQWQVIHVPSGAPLLYAAICLRHARQVADELAALPVDWTIPDLEAEDATEPRAAALSVLAPWLHGERSCVSRCRALPTATTSN